MEKTDCGTFLPRPDGNVGFEQCLSFVLWTQEHHSSCTTDKNRNTDLLMYCGNNGAGNKYLQLTKSYSVCTHDGKGTIP